MLRLNKTLLQAILLTTCALEKLHYIENDMVHFNGGIIGYLHLAYLLNLPNHNLGI